MSNDCVGPPLWNLVYADARFAVRKLNFEETMFVDDFNCWTESDKETKDLDGVMRLPACQHELHAWREANQVTSDHAKEEYACILQFQGMGPVYTIWGGGHVRNPIVDAQRARNIAMEAGW